MAVACPILWTPWDPFFPFLVAQKHGSALRDVTLYFAFFCRPVEMMG